MRSARALRRVLRALVGLSAMGAYATSFAFGEKAEAIASGIRRYL